MDNNFNNNVNNNFNANNNNYNINQQQGRPIVEEKKKGSASTVIIFIVVIFIIIALVLGVWFVLNKNKTSEPAANTNLEPVSNEVPVSGIEKVNNSLYYVYDANYYKQQTNVGYFYNNQYCSSKDLNYPFINIKSADVNSINQEIMNLFVNSYKTLSTYASNNAGYVKVDYKYYLNDNYLSVVITTTVVDPENTSTSYKAYNIDVTTAKKLTFADVYKKVGFSADTINSTILNAINNDEVYTIYANEFITPSIANTSRSNAYNDYVAREIALNATSVITIDNDSNKLVYFIDGNMNLNVDIIYTLPSSNTSVYKLIKVSKQDEKSNLDIGTVQQTTYYEISDLSQLSNYQGYYANYIAGTNNANYEAHIYEENGEWFLNISKGIYKQDKEKEEIDKLKLSINGGILIFNQDNPVFKGRITINKDGTLGITITNSSVEYAITADAIILDNKIQTGSIVL